MIRRQQLSWIPKYFGLVIVIIAVWEYAAQNGYIAPYMLPAPHKIVKTFWLTAADQTLLQNIWASIVRVFSGFALAALAATVIGVLISLSKNFEIATRLILQLLKPIPPIAWIPIAIIWLGIDEPSKVFIIFMGAFFPILLNTVGGIRQIDHQYVEVSRVLEVPRAKFVKKVMVPGALPQIMTGLRVGLGNAWICVVAAEMIAATRGIGYMLMDGRQLAQPDKVILAMLLVGVIGKFMDDILGRIEKKVLYW